jgi:hypothetical protein
MDVRGTAAPFPPPGRNAIPERPVALREQSKRVTAMSREVRRRTAVVVEGLRALDDLVIVGTWARRGGLLREDAVVVFAQAESLCARARELAETASQLGWEATASVVWSRTLRHRPSISGGADGIVHRAFPPHRPRDL